ncbi:MAG: hypothetical protein ABII07_02620 [Patescibacteria group bacterium]|nr:hypothetical protein [Patescibacteria group bacterium]
MKLKALAAGLAVGVFWGVLLFILTVVSLYTGYMETQLGLLVGIYPVYEISWMGALAGLLDGFIDGFFMGLVLALLYNAFASCICCCESSCEKKPEPKKKTTKKKKK